MIVEKAAVFIWGLQRQPERFLKHLQVRGAVSLVIGFVHCLTDLEVAGVAGDIIVVVDESRGH